MQISVRSGVDLLKPVWGLADKVSVHRSAFIGALLMILAVHAAAGNRDSDARGSATETPGEIGGVAAPGPTWMPSTLSAHFAGAPDRLSAYSIVPSYTIRRTVPEVRLQFSIADERGRLVTSLTQDDFRILDNQATVRHILNFSRLDDLPLQLGLLLDVSDSVQKSVLREKLAAQSFLQMVLRPQTDRAFLIAFGRDVRLWQTSTGDRTELSQALQRIQQLGYSTNLYDGLYSACARQFPQPARDEAVQRVVLLFSDGEDTDSLHGMTDVIALAQRKEVQIYAISMHASRKLLHGDEVLQQMADQTGGHFYPASTEKDLPAVFAEMQQEMRTQYYVSFRPQQETPGFHELRLESTGPQKLRVHARQGYYFDAP